MGVNALEVRRRVMLAQPHEAVASGTVASFRTDVVSALPMEFDLVPIQAGTGDPSPENVRPITGHDGFTRTGTGKNLYPIAIGTDTWNNFNNGSALNDNGVLVVSMAAQLYSGCYSRAVSPSSKISLLSEMNVKASYSASIKASANADIFFGYNRNGNRKISLTTNYQRFTFDNLDFGTIKTLNIYNGSANAVTVYVKDFQFELGRVSTDYEPYTGTSYSTTFPTPPGTVYGGHVTDNGDGTGSLTVDRYEHTFTGNENFLTNASSWGVYAFLYDTGVQIQTSLFSPSLCKSSHFVLPDSGGWSSLTPGKYMTAGGTYIGLGFDGTKDELKAWLASQASNNTPVQVVCGLTTPVTYTLSLTAIQSLIGQNNIWVDNADSVSVEYWGH